MIDTVRVRAFTSWIDRMTKAFRSYQFEFNDEAQLNQIISLTISKVSLLNYDEISLRNFAPISDM